MGQGIRDIPRRTDPAFAGLRMRVLAASGLDLALYKDACILRRIGVRLRACGAGSLTAYVERLNRDRQELTRLIQALTIHVSQFFRNPSTYRAIGEQILPTLLADKRQAGARALRLWSAGCATGEEPYSLAILLLERAPEVVRELSTVIYATDVDAETLERAREGVFPARSLAHLPPAWRARHFTADGTRYRVGAVARRLVFFKEHNLLRRPPVGRLDLIVCRNVLIYMAPPVQGQVLEAFQRVLNPGGFLVLGKVEGLTPGFRERFEVVDPAERIYRRSPAPMPVSP